MTTTWGDALDALEERLRRQAAVLAGTLADAPAGGLPLPDGPLPECLLPRALVLLERTQQLEHETAAALAVMRGMLNQRAYTGAATMAATAFDL